jgi:subtilisin family serine protease
MYNGWPLPSVSSVQVHSEQTTPDLRPFLIHFSGNSGGSDRAALKTAGWEVIGYLSGDWWLVYPQSGTDIRKTYALEKSMGILPVEPQWKAAPALRSLPSEAAGEEIDLIVYAQSISSGLRSAIEEAGGTISSVPLTPGKARLGVKVPYEKVPSFLDTLIMRPEVYLIQPGAGAETFNDNASCILQNGSSLVESRPLWDRGLYGQGQVVAVLDTGLDYDSCYFAEADASAPPLVLGVTGEGAPDLSRRKVLIYDLLYSGDFGASLTDFDNQGHGTLVAGNALGSALADPLGRDDQNGIAPEARLVVQDAGFTTYDDCSDLAALGCPVVDLSPFLEQAYGQGARIHNNSWGARENYTPGNTYTGPTSDMDQAVWDHPDFAIVCAAGNAGAWDTVSSPSVGKNVLSIGACGSPSYSGNENTLAGFSSRGWASDGRIKPDLIAPGMTTTSSSDRNPLTQNCTTSLAQGTSMASPVTAGCVALVRQYFAEGWYPTGQANPGNAMNPSAALVKAVS